MKILLPIKLEGEKMCTDYLLPVPVELKNKIVVDFCSQYKIESHFIIDKELNEKLLVKVFHPRLKMDETIYLKIMFPDL